MRIYKKIVSLLIVLAVIFSGIISVSAESNLIFGGSFSNDTEKYFTLVDKKFDLNNDERSNGEDMIFLKKILLNVKGYSSEKSDLNNDGKTNIIDLVVMKKGFINCSSIIKDGRLIVSDNIIYTDQLVSKMESDSYYEISFDYKSNDGNAITVYLSGANAKDIVFNSATAATWSKYSKVFKTGNKLSPSVGSELTISGNGAIDNLKIVKVSGYWNDSSNKDQGAADIF